MPGRSLFLELLLVTDIIRSQGFVLLGNLERLQNQHILLEAEGPMERAVIEIPGGESVGARLGLGLAIARIVRQQPKGGLGPVPIPLLSKGWIVQASPSRVMMMPGMRSLLMLVHFPTRASCGRRAFFSCADATRVLPSRHPIADKNAIFMIQALCSVEPLRRTC